MPVTVVVGGQFGSEGKGKVSAHLARASNVSAVVRVGGSNSGHGAVDAEGVLVSLRQLPAGAIRSDATLVLPPGSLIDVTILMREIDLLRIEPDRLRIDSRASIVTSRHTAKEQEDGLRASIGSTESGTGAALLERLGRSPKHIRARDISALRPYIDNDTTAYMRKLLDNGQRILIEGTQGFGLSIWHSDSFPFATSRDTTAAGFVSEAGLAPHDVDDVVLVLRTFPIRVGGNSGPLPNEITWPELAAEAHLPADFKEYTTATHRVRRVARFDSQLVKRAIATNRPHRIVLNHMDYVDPEGQSQSGHDFLIRIENEIGRRFDFLGYGADSLVPRGSVF